MSRNFYCEIHFHIVWHTKNSLPLLNQHVEPLAYRFLKRRIIDTPGAFVHEIGGTETHVHLSLTVPPTLLMSEFIGQLKGGSSHDVNQAVERNSKVLQWQVGYGIVSFGTRDLEWVNEYVRNQKEHHARGQVHERLERIEEFAVNEAGSSRCGEKAGEPA